MTKVTSVYRRKQCIICEDILARKELIYKMRKSWLHTESLRDRLQSAHEIPDQMMRK
jgi:hypothetical protein